MIAPLVATRKPAGAHLASYPSGQRRLTVNPVLHCIRGFESLTRHRETSAKAPGDAGLFASPAPFSPTSRPDSIRTTTSASAMSRSSWLTHTTATPPLAVSSAIARRISAALVASIAVVGSSRSSRSAPRARPVRGGPADAVRRRARRRASAAGRSCPGAAAPRRRRPDRRAPATQETHRPHAPMTTTSRTERGAARRRRLAANESARTRADADGSRGRRCVTPPAPPSASICPSRWRRRSPSESARTMSMSTPSRARSRRNPRGCRGPRRR